MKSKSKSSSVSAKAKGLKAIPASEMVVLVGDVEYSTFVTELREMNASVVCGYTGDSFTGTPIYAYLRSKQDEMKSYVNIGKNHFYPKTRIRTAIQEYFDFLARKNSTETQTPEVTELLRKLAQNPELAKALLELVA
jgi:spore germination protein GerM